MITLENGLNVYEIEEIERIKYLKSQNKEYGYIYILKYTNDTSDKEIIKIGVSMNPYLRITHFIKTLDNYSFAKIEKFALTKMHMNYYDNEKILHEHYKDYRKQGRELFYFKFDEVCNNIYNIIKMNFEEHKSCELQSDYIDDDIEYEEEEENRDIVKMEIGLTMNIIRDCGLSCATVYNILLSHKPQYSTHGCSLPYDELMKECYISSKSTLTSYLSKLEEFGYIKIKSGNKGYFNQYYFPLSSKMITNYTDTDLNYIKSIRRKKGNVNQNVSINSLKNLKNRK